MPGRDAFILGEFRRRLDDRHRVAVPGELAVHLMGGAEECILAKERAGCLSLWNAAVWQGSFEDRVQLIQQKMHVGNLHGQIAQVQMLGRLLSTRHTVVQMDKQTRVLIPKQFRDFLGVEPGGDVMVVGAAVCVEFWDSEAWLRYIRRRMPRFRRLFHHLSK